MTTQWQTWAALTVVLITATVMAYRTFFRKKTGCGSGCGCGGAKKKI
jgi:hypothetical protein